MAGNLNRPHAHIRSREELMALDPASILEIAGFAATRAMVKGKNGDTSLSRVETWALILLARLLLPPHSDVHVSKRDDDSVSTLPSTAGTDI